MYVRCRTIYRRINKILVFVCKELRLHDAMAVLRNEISEYDDTSSLAILSGRFDHRENYYNITQDKDLRVK